MLWRKRRASAQTGKTKAFPIDEIPLVYADRATQNVMWAREQIVQMFNWIDYHRSDGHDCMPYCLPREVREFLDTLEIVPLKVLLITALMDSVPLDGHGAS